VDAYCVIVFVFVGLCIVIFLEYFLFIYFPVYCGYITYDMSDNTANVTFVIDGEERSFSVPIGETNLLQVALNNGIHLDHACGGVGMCSTCKVTVQEGMDSLSERSQSEELFEVTGEDRLSCQCTVNGDVKVEIPTA